MNLHFLSSAASAAHEFEQRQRSESRAAGVARLADWIAHGVAVAHRQPLWWVCALLVCADFVTLLELVPRLQVLAPLVAPLAAGLLVLMQERASNARPWSLGEALTAIDGQRNALVAVGLGAAALAGLGHAVQYAAFHMSVTPAGTADGAHGLSIVFGTHRATQTPFEALVAVPFYVLGIAAFWFAPALVVLRKLSPLDAMVASLRAVLRNWPAALVYAAAIGAAGLSAPVVPMLVRGLVVTPIVSALIVLSMYGSYREVFGQR